MLALLAASGEAQLSLSLAASEGWDWGGTRGIQGAPHGRMSTGTLGPSPKAAVVAGGAGTSQCHPALRGSLTPAGAAACPGRSEQSPVIYYHKTSQTSLLLLRWLWGSWQPLLPLETQHLSLNSAVLDYFWEQAAMLLLVTTPVLWCSCWSQACSPAQIKALTPLQTVCQHL